MNKSLTILVIFLLVIIFCTIFIVSYVSEFRIEKTLDSDNLIKNTNILLMPRKSSELIIYKSKDKDNSTIDLHSSISTIKQEIVDGYYDAAENRLRNLLLFYPKNKTVLSLLGGLLYSSGKYQQSSEMFRILVSNGYDDYNAKEKMGMVLKKQGKYSEAINLFQQGSKLSPKSAAMYIYLAGLHSVMGKKKYAIYNFIRAYKLIGSKIIPLSFDPAFDNIRSMPEFILIVNLN